MDKLHWKLDPDGQMATLTLPTDPPIAIRLDAAQIDVMVQELGLFRATMRPPHPTEWASGQEAIMEPYPHWRAERDSEAGGTLLHLRDPRFGWLHYVFPPTAALELGRCLVMQADTPPDGPSQADGD